MAGIESKIDALTAAIDALSQKSSASELKLDTLLVKIGKTDENINTLVQQVTTVQQKLRFLKKPKKSSKMISIG